MALFYGKNLPFFKCSLNFRADALQSELNKVGYTNFFKFVLQSMSSKIEQEFEKGQNIFSEIFVWLTQTLTSFFLHFLIIFFFFIFHMLNLHLVYLLYTIFYVSMTFINVVKNKIFQESSTSNETKLAILFFFVFFTCTTQNQSGIIK